MYVVSRHAELLTTYITPFSFRLKPKKKKRAKMKNEGSKNMSRYYSFRLISYLNKESIEKICKEKCNHYAYIYHDKDTTEEGNPKEPHFHIVCTTKQPKSINSIRREFDDTSGQNTLAKVADDMQLAYNYLTHKDNPEKYQYKTEEITHDDIKYWIKVSKDENTERPSNEEFIKDLFKFNPLQMSKKYGRDYIKNFERYDYFRRYVSEEMQRRNGWWKHEYNEDIDLIEAIYVANEEQEKEQPRYTPIKWEDE